MRRAKKFYTDLQLCSITVFVIDYLIIVLKEGYYYDFTNPAGVSSKYHIFKNPVSQLSFSNKGSNDYVKGSSLVRTDEGKFQQRC